MAIKIPRNLHLMVIIFVAALMMIGFILRGIGSENATPVAPKPAQADPAPDQRVLLEEIRKQNEAALEAELALRAREAELERARQELASREAELSHRPAEKNTGPVIDEKALERKEAAALSSIIAMRGSEGIMGKLGLVNGAQKEVGTDDPYQAIRNAMNPPRNEDDRTPNQKWLDVLKDKASDKNVVTPDAARTGLTLHEGTVIRAILQTRINSDLPGMITARVMSNIYDTQTGLKLAIPAGSRIVGRYNTKIELGQERVMAAFHRIILPDGRSLHLKGASGSDAQGAAGLTADVDTHFWGMLGSQLLVATIAYASENDRVSSGTTVNVSGDSQSAHGKILVNTAEKAMARYSGRKPTLTVEPGTVFTILANQDIVLGGGL